MRAEQKKAISPISLNRNCRLACLLARRYAHLSKLSGECAFSPIRVAEPSPEVHLTHKNERGRMNRRAATSERSRSLCRLEHLFNSRAGKVVEKNAHNASFFHLKQFRRELRCALMMIIVAGVVWPRRGWPGRGAAHNWGMRHRKNAAECLV